MTRMILNFETTLRKLGLDDGTRRILLGMYQDIYREAYQDGQDDLREALDIDTDITIDEE